MIRNEQDKIAPGIVQKSTDVRTRVGGDDGWRFPIQGRRYLEGEARKRLTSDSSTRHQKSRTAVIAMRPPKQTSTSAPGVRWRRL